VSRWYLAITALLVGPGCAGTKIEYVPFEVQVEVPVPCAAEIPTEPAWATGKLRKADTLDEKAKGLIVEREQHQGYEKKLKAAVTGCQ
jgi:hypothetical protein